MSSLATKNLKKVSFLGAALMLSIFETAGITLSNILEGPQLGIGKAYNRILRRRSIGDYYEILKNMNEKSARTILWRLEKKGLVQKKDKRYFLSKMGLAFIQNEIQIKKEWDGKWRLVAFDVPEKLRSVRDWLRGELYKLNYKQLQKSLFIGKEPLDRRLVKELISKSLNEYVRIIVVGEIDDESVLDGV